MQSILEIKHWSSFLTLLRYITTLSLIPFSFTTSQEGDLYCCNVCMNIIIAQWSKNMARKPQITSSNHLGGLFIFAELNIWKLQFMHDHARYHNQVIFAEFTIVSHLKEIYKMEIRPKCLTLIILVLHFTFRLEKELVNFLIKVWWTRY